MGAALSPSAETSTSPCARMLRASRGDPGPVGVTDRDRLAARRPQRSTRRHQTLRTRGFATSVCDVLFQLIALLPLGFRAEVPGGKGVPPATAGPRRPSQPGPSTLAWQRERCAVQQGPASLYRSLSARSANNLSVSARLLDRNLRNLRRKQEICAVKPAGSPRPISLTAHKTSRESVPPLRTNARLHQAAAAAARPGTGILGRVTSEGRAIMWGHGGSGTSKRGGGDAGWAL
jgi:hypothetical protein